MTDDKIIDFYVSRILKGYTNLDAVPVNIRDKVQDIINNKKGEK